MKYDVVAYYQGSVGVIQKCKSIEEGITYFSVFTEDADVCIVDNTKTPMSEKSVIFCKIGKKDQKNVIRN